MTDKRHFPWNLNPTAEEAAWWRRWLYRRAAELFEETKEYIDAAECWVGAGFPDRAVELYVREGSYRTATDVLLSEKRTEEALSLCEIWRENAGPETETLTNDLGMEFVWIPPGTFWMGSSLTALGFSETFIRMWEFYLSYCEGSFLERYIGDVQAIYARPRCRQAPIPGAL